VSHAQDSGDCLLSVYQACKVSLREQERDARLVASATTMKFLSVSMVGLVASPFCKAYWKAFIFAFGTYLSFSPYIVHNPKCLRFNPCTS
jgi:hypothetical protein